MDMSTPNKIKILQDKINKGIEKYKSEFLLGCIEVDDETYCELLDFSSALINRATFVLKKERYAIISIALVLFAVNEYQNGQFWSEFAKRVNAEESDVNKICKESFEKFCEINGVYFHVGNVNKGYVTSILTHAIIPKSNVNRFLEFLHDIYFKDLEENYIDNEVEELIQYMHRLFTKYLEDDDISLIVQGSKMTIARQQLPKSFRIAFVKATSIVVPIIERLLFYMNQSHYGDVVEYLENDRFDQYFDLYDYYSSKKTIEKSKRGQVVEHIKKFNVAQYQYDNRKIFLQIPKQIIDSDYIENQITLEIYCGDNIIHREDLLLTKSRLFFKSEQTCVEIQQFYPQIVYRINSGNQIIYNSGELLFREFVFFDLDGNEVNPKQLSDETIRVITKKENEVLSDNTQIDIVFESNYRVSTVFLNEESILLINDRILSTNVATIKNEIDSKFKYQGIVIRNTSKVSFDLYSEIPEIRIRIPYMKGIDDFIVTINGSNYHMNKVADCKVKLICDGSGDNLGLVHIRDSVLKSHQPFSIVIREKGSNKIYIEENVFAIGSLYYNFDKDYYYKEKEAKLLTFNSNDIDFNLDLQLPIAINIKENKVFSSIFYLHSVEYEIEIKLPVLSWRIGSINSDMKNSDNIWWENVKDYRLYVKFPNKPSRLNIISNSGYEKLEGKRIGDEVKYSLDHLFQISEQDPITLGIHMNGKEECITNIHFKPAIRDFSVAYYDYRNLTQCLYANWSFLGIGGIEIDVIYFPTQKVIKHYELSNSDHLMDKDITLYYNEYEIEIYQVEEDDFFGECAVKNVLLREKFIVGDPLIVACRNKVLKGNKCISESENFDLSNFYIKNIKFAKKKGYYEATGLYYIKDRYTGDKREWYFTNYNPFIIKPIKQENGRFTFEIVDRDEDGLIYDIKTKYVNPRKYGNSSRYKLIDIMIFEIIE